MSFLRPGVIKQHKPNQTLTVKFWRHYLECDDLDSVRNVWYDTRSAFGFLFLENDRQTSLILNVYQSIVTQIEFHFYL